VARTVFKIAEVVARRLVGSIPTRSRQSRPSTGTNRCQAFQEAYNARPACQIEIAPAQREKFTATQAGTDCHRECAAELELLALIDVKGTLHGTTEEGGTRQHGKVFLLKP
jgi:hypothetical protein